ncbi:ATPase AAA [Kordiimonas sediminis]|uniref:ATPase AAA n=1 Tax=Kordiimonas sediminis TaxID=1735581 RepID=A0A919E8Z7_9PROT|nr:ATP-binding protein [Kordiimonas sediminis]GHF26052.1 ATPase AAA [Kordiimonas sediminis]
MEEKILETLTRIADALEQQNSPVVSHAVDPNKNAFVFDVSTTSLISIDKVAAPPLSLLLGVDRTKNTLLENTVRFANGFSANNALLWGARGMGKSTLVKALHKHINETNPHSRLGLVEIHREDISALPSLMALLKNEDRPFVVFCDDLSFNRPDRDFKALKSVLEGGLEGRPNNVLFYATSNRRHLMPRSMMDQEQATAINPTEAMDETIALSDRFGLWLGFHACDQKDYLAMIEGYFAHLGLPFSDTWKEEALNWSKTRGSRSGRVAWQFVTDYAGRNNRTISL